MVRFATIDSLCADPPVDLGTTAWVRLSTDDVQGFAQATRAHEWIHVDADRARRQGPFGGPVAHGYLTLSLATHFITALLAVDGLPVGVNYGLERVRFPAPVPVGAQVRATGTLRSASPQAGGARTLVELVVECDAADKPACVADVVSLLLPTT